MAPEPVESVDPNVPLQVHTEPAEAAATTPNPEPAEGTVTASDLVQPNQNDPSDKSGKSLNEVAREVLASHWSRGNKRRKRLTDAGYDPVAVQAEIDKILNQ